MLRSNSKHLAWFYNHILFIKLSYQNILRKIFVKNHQISSIFLTQIKGFYCFIFFFPKLIKSMLQLWSSGKRWILQNSFVQCLQSYPSIPVFLLHLIQRPFFILSYSVSYLYNYLLKLLVSSLTKGIFFSD